MEDIITNFELASTRLLSICPVCNKFQDKPFALGKEQRFSPSHVRNAVFISRSCRRRRAASRYSRRRVIAPVLNTWAAGQHFAQCTVTVTVAID